MPTPAPASTVLSTSAIPNNDTMARTPVGARPPDDASDRSEEQPTLRVPVRPPTGVAPGPLATTPPPVDALKVSGSTWSGDGADAFPTTRRGPRVGDTVLGFKLVGELGRGAFARVFLAHQQALANRPVALKISFRPTREAERLARLQHTNIVPVYSVHDEDPVQIICMPYLGRVTLADLIRAYRVEHPAGPSGRKSTSARAGRTTAHDSHKPPSKPGSDSKSGSGAPRVPTWTWASEGPPPIAGDPRAVLQLLVQLAAGLTHAHDRGILHLDIKPANVLLADTGEPMLLDFNLSFDAARPERDLVGGTMPYMAIEQILDMRDRGKGVIDARTDLYALGVMAFELLTGTVPFPSSSKHLRDLEGLVRVRRQGPPALRTLNPAVTPAVEAIVRKLLAPDPADRYQTAEELRIDAERHLNDLPLRYAREGSVRERLGKWRRRNPGVPLRIAVACLLGLAIGLGGVVQRRSEATARYEAVERARATRAALDSTRLDLIFPDDPKARARGVTRATEVLATYGLPGATDWQKRPEVRRLSEAERVELAGALGELMLLLAEVKWQEAAARPEADRLEPAAEAWALNAAARTVFGGSAPPLADRQAAVIAPAVGESFEQSADPAVDADANPRALFLDAVDALHHGRYVAAIPLLDRVIAAQPDHAAAQFCLAYCRQKTGQYQRALERYDAARVLLPTDPRPAYQRGLIYTTNNKPAQAEEEFTKAISLDATHAEAHGNRGLARFRLGMTKAGEKGAEAESAKKLAAAEADLSAALELGASAPLVHFVRARVRDARADRAGAAADREAAKGAQLKTEADYIARGWSRVACDPGSCDPKGALADFRKAAEINPRSLCALQNQAHVLADHLKDNGAALAVVTKTANLYPEFAPAVSGRAIVLARLGRREEAHKEIERARLLSDDADVTYQAACVYSVTSATHPEDRPKAVQLLRQALRDGFRDTRRLAKDQDLEPLRADKEFQTIRQSAAALFR
jgi:serine/threonine protein kinase/Flp pilus assembly protein TadD